MVEKLTNLYNALLTVETKGSNTLTMANCLRYTEQLIAETRELESTGVCEPVVTEE